MHNTRFGCTIRVLEKRTSFPERIMCQNAYWRPESEFPNAYHANTSTWHTNTRTGCQPVRVFACQFAFRQCQYAFWLCQYAYRQWKVAPGQVFWPPNLWSHDDDVTVSVRQDDDDYCKGETGPNRRDWNGQGCTRQICNQHTASAATWAGCDRRGCT